MNNTQDSKTRLEKTKAHLNTEFTQDHLPPELTQEEENYLPDLSELYNEVNKKDNGGELSQAEASDNVENLNSEMFSIKIPKYLQDIYTWAYLNPKNVQLLDRNVVVHILLFFNANRLINSYLAEVPAGSHMLQIAHVYGDMIPRLAKKIGPQGQLDLIDVAKVQLAHAYKKLKNFKNTDIWQQDATVAYHREYDIVGSFFLLHEVPMKAKIAIINNMLKQVENHGAKAVFIDYHRPSNWHPLKPVLLLVNTFLEPFANELWEFDIQDLAPKSDKFIWKKTTYFGGLYQKVVVTKK